MRLYDIDRFWSGFLVHYLHDYQIDLGSVTEAEQPRIENRRETD